MMELLMGDDNTKFYVLTKYPNNFKTQEEFTKWEQRTKSNDLAIFLYKDYVAVCYPIKDAEFIDVTEDVNKIENN